MPSSSTKPWNGAVNWVLGLITFPPTLNVCGFSVNVTFGFARTEFTTPLKYVETFPPLYTNATCVQAPGAVTKGNVWFAMTNVNVN